MLNYQSLQAFLRTAHEHVCSHMPGYTLCLHTHAYMHTQMYAHTFEQAIPDAISHNIQRIHYLEGACALLVQSASLPTSLHASLFHSLYCGSETKCQQARKTFFTCLLRELLPLLQPIAFKIPTHLGVVSFTLKSSSSPALSLALDSASCF